MKAEYQVLIKYIEGDYYHYDGGFESVESAKDCIQTYIDENPTQEAHFQIWESKPILKTQYVPKELVFEEIK